MMKHIQNLYTQCIDVVGEVGAIDINENIVA